MSRNEKANSSTRKKYLSEIRLLYKIYLSEFQSIHVQPECRQTETKLLMNDQLIDQIINQGMIIIDNFSTSSEKSEIMFSAPQPLLWECKMDLEDIPCSSLFALRHLRKQRFNGECAIYMYIWLLFLDAKKKEWSTFNFLNLLTRRSRRSRRRRSSKRRRTTMP